MTRFPLDSRIKECAIRWSSGYIQNLKEMATELIITVFSSISEKKKKDSKGTQLLPLRLLVNPSYFYPKNLPVDTPSNRSSAVPLRCLKGNYRQGTFFKVRWIVINLATLLKVLRIAYRDVLAIISLKHFYLKWNLFVKYKQTCACATDHTSLQELLVNSTSVYMISLLNTLLRYFIPCVLIVLIGPRQKWTQFWKER